MQTSKAISSAQILGQTQEHLCHISDRVAIHHEMKLPFQAMVLAAKKDGIELVIASGFRSFERQLQIWNNKFSGKTAIKDSVGNTIDSKVLTSTQLLHSILLFSALPGASRHHWGCDIDVYAPNLLPDGYQLQLEPSEYSEQGPMAKLSIWLSEHASEFGFYLPYANYHGGVAQEPWHLSYAPLAQRYHKAFNITLLRNAIDNSDIIGKEVILANIEDIAKRYINNICSTPANIDLT
mgnify:CR=1 FL=1